MSNSKLVVYTKISPNKTSPRKNKIKKITIHHMAGNLSVESCGNVFSTTTRKASANYGIGTDGRIGLYVDERDRAWTSSSADNDNQAVTIEVANDSGAPSWHVSDKALESLIQLCTDICKRNGIEKLNYTGDKNGNLTMHKYFTATTCPGPYLESKFPYIAQEVNKRLGVAEEVVTKTPQECFIEEFASYVNKHRKAYGIEVASAIIAQGILESDSGTSDKVYIKRPDGTIEWRHNYLGLKWRNKRIAVTNEYFTEGTSEQNDDSTYDNIRSKFFKFNSMEECVIGYFQFINNANYANLKGVTDPYQYLVNIKADKYATSHDYVKNVYAVIERYNLTKYDSKIESDISSNEAKCPFVVKVNIPDLNIRTGPGTNYSKLGRYTKVGSFTIVEVKQGKGSKKGWGKLKSGLGWISLDHCEF